MDVNHVYVTISTISISIFFNHIHINKKIHINANYNINNGGRAGGRDGDDNDDDGDDDNDNDDDEYDVYDAYVSSSLLYFNLNQYIKQLLLYIYIYFLVFLYIIKHRADSHHLISYCGNDICNPMK